MNKKIMEKLQLVLWALKQIAISAPKEASLLVLLLIFQGLLPAFGLLIIQKIVNWVLYVDQNSSFLLILTIFWVVVLFIEIAGEPFMALNRIKLNAKILAHYNILLMKKANAFENLEPFENKHSYDEMQFLKEEAKWRPLNFIYTIMGCVRASVAIIGVLIMLAWLNSWVPFFVLLTVIPHAISTLWFEKQAWDLALFKSPEVRRMAWLSSLTLEEKAAKEIRLFGFGHFLVDRYIELARSFQKTMLFRKNKQTLRLISLSTLTVFGQLGCFIWFIFNTKKGTLTGGELVMGLQALICAQRELSVLMQHLGLLAQNLLFFGKFKTFLFINLPVQKTNAKVFISLEKAIIFHDVSFSYPDGRVALKNVNLHIRSGEKIALVGENGAGKSTLIKLLLRFYNPTKGHITIDGIDLREWDLHSWRKQISAVFQDFGQYQLTAIENIALGEIERLQDVSHVAWAACKAGFAPIAEALPKGYNTLLGKEWGGTSLSGGQWQKLAMSRAFMKEASILILDEPTASLDPKSEQAVFKIFSDIAKDKTTFLITHRMASAFMADRAIVLKDGEIVEQGPHQELLKAEGEYASLYSLQANQFRN